MPSVASAPPGDDLIAIGADLAPGTLLEAYRNGLFPMPIDPARRRSKIAWYSPDPRGVMPLDGMRVSRSLRRSAKRYRVTMNQDFAGVIRACADPSRPGYWITDEIIDAYERMFELGWAHSVEVWADDDLVGGLYGLRINGLFAAESMFHWATDASKVALFHLVGWVNDTDASLLDVQWSTPHLASLGVVEVGRAEYLHRLVAATSES